MGSDTNSDTGDGNRISNEDEGAREVASRGLAEQIDCWIGVNDIRPMITAEAPGDNVPNLSQVSEVPENHEDRSKYQATNHRLTQWWNALWKIE